MRVQTQFLSDLREEGGPVSEIQVCGTCARHRFDWNAEDFVCENDRSQNFGAWTDSCDTCEAWQAKKRRKHIDNQSEEEMT